MENDNFLFNKSWRDAIRDLPPEIKLEVYEGVMDYCLEGKTPELSFPASIAFNFIKQDYDRQRDNYKKARGGNPNFKTGQPNPYYNKIRKITEDNPTLPEITEDNSEITLYKQQIEIETEIENTISPDGECEEHAPEGNSSLPTSESIPYRKICDVWNETADKVPGMPKVAKLTDARKRKIAQRIREMGEKDIGKAMETYAAVLDKIPQSPFFTEKWQPDFDWLFANGSNWVKVLEGNYAKYGKPQRQNPPREPTKPVKIITSINKL